ARSAHARGEPSRRGDRTDAHRVRDARALSPQPAPGLDAVDHLRARVGLRLRLRVELARRVHRVSAAEDGGGRAAAPDPHGARRRVRAAGAMNFRNLSFRARLTLVAAAAVALAVVLASVVVWLVVRSQLRSQVDNDLRTRSAEISSGGPLHLEQFPDGHIYLDVHRDVLAGGGFVQLVGPNGKTYRTPDESGSLPVDKRVLDVAKGQNKSFITDASISGTDVRVMTVPVANSVTGQHFALQVAQDVSSVSHTL